MMLIEEKPHCIIEYDPTSKCVIQTWRGFSGSKNFRASLEKTIEVFKEHDVTGIISNTQAAQVVSEGDAKWVTTHVNPILIEHGLQRIAFVLPKNSFAQWSVGNFFKNIIDQRLDAKYFDDISKAKTWISR